MGGRISALLREIIYFSNIIVKSTSGLLFLALTFFAIEVDAKYYNYDVPYINQLDYAEWGQSACGPTSITMLLRYWYPNALIDVPEVYHAATQQNSYYNTYKGKTIGAPLLGYYNIGWALGKGCCWVGTNPDTGFGEDRVPKEFQKYHRGKNSGMAPNNAVTYLTTIWDGTTELRVNQTMEHIINEIKNRPVILNVDEGYGGHYIVLRGYDEESNIFYINDPYAPYQDSDRIFPFENANNAPITYETLERWFQSRMRMIIFQPNADHNETTKQYTVIVDNGIANFGDADNLNANCKENSHCFEVDDINARTQDNKYVWLCYHLNGKDWIYPVEDGHWVQWKPKLAKNGLYRVLVKFHGDKTQTNVKYDIYDSIGNLIGSEIVNQATDGYQSVSLGDYYLIDGAHVGVKNMPANCNADAIMFQYLGDPFIYGSSGNGLSSGPSHLYKVITSADGTDDDIGLIATAGAEHPLITDLALTPDRNLYGVSFNRFYHIDSVNATATPIGGTYNYSINALASDKNGNLYAAAFSTGQFLSIDKNTGNVTLIGQFGSGYGSSGDLAFSPDGTLYATVRSSIANDILVTINPNNGQSSRINSSIDTGTKYIFGLSFVGNDLYGLTAEDDGKGALWLFDLTTGKANFVRELNFQAFGAAAVKYNK